MKQFENPVLGLFNSFYKSAGNWYTQKKICHFWKNTSKSCQLSFCTICAMFFFDFSGKICNSENLENENFDWVCGIEAYDIVFWLTHIPYLNYSSHINKTTHFSHSS